MTALTLWDQSPALNPIRMAYLLIDLLITGLERSAVVVIFEEAMEKIGRVSSVGILAQAERVSKLSYRLLGSTEHTLS